jgi:hypothetical protein
VSFLLGVLVALAARYAYLKWRASSEAAPPGTASSAASKGPWGILEYEKIPLANSSRFFADSSQRLQTPRWIFEGFTPTQLRELFAACSFNAEQKSFFLDTNHWVTLTNGLAISPPDALIQKLSQPTRQLIYPVLARDPANYAQSRPYRMPLRGLDERFAESGLNAARIELIRSQTYTNGGSLCVCADRPFSSMFDTNELQRVMRALYTTPTWLVRLRLERDTDIEALVRYWGVGGRETSIRSILASLARNRGGDSINIASLLPPFPRLRLYTYPDPYTDAAIMQEDGIYTALNFFSEQPDPQYLDRDKARSELERDYDSVRSASMLGDIIMLVNAAGEAVHVCVYVADGIVFTKTGANALQPWVLMKLPDMLTFFPSDTPQRLVVYRRKALEPRP